MNKNLKKVISTIAAIAMTASTFVAFAANYPDVDASASYKQAVDEISALNIVEGYPDGTFGPDKLVTRAEFSKMLITTLGKAQVAQAESSEGSNTGFRDVPGSHWASGYVSAAVTNGYINGYGDGTFGPDDNVTYAQAMKMLVCAAGYEQWAVDLNGIENAWPNGYLYYANQVDIGKGVKDVNNTTELTRAQVAQMIDNTLTAPALVKTGKTNFNQYGQSIPELIKKDGKGEDYQSILTLNHDAYKVKGMITDDNKSTAGSLKADEVRFQVKVAKNFDDEEVKSTEPLDAQKMYIAEGVDASAMLNKYAEAIIQRNDDDDWVIIAISETGASDTVSTLADNFEYDNKNYADGDYVGAGKFYVRENNKTTSYKLADDVVMFVNGVKVADTDADVNKAIDTFVKGNTTSDVTLIDTPASDSTTTDGYYDQIMVDYYATAVVDSVEGEADDDITINFDAFYGKDLDDVVTESSMDVDLTNEDKTYTFSKDGAAIDPKELAQDDVLSIKYDVSEGNSFANSNFYDVLVSSKTDAGKCTTRSKDKTIGEDDYYKYTVNGTVYKVADTQVGDLKSGTEYTVYLDVFGRIASVEEGLDSKKFAILENAWEANGNDVEKVKLILPDGSDKEFEVKDTLATGSDDWNTIKGYVAKNDTTNKKPGAQDRVVEYKTSGEKISYIKKETAKANEDGNGEYKANSDKIGKFTISTEATSFIDASDIDDIKSMSVSTLKDGNSYTAYFFNKANSDSYYRFVVVTSNAGDAIDTSAVAVYVSTADVQNDSDEDTQSLEIVEGNETKNVLVATDADALPDLAEGDAIMYDTNSKGEIKTVYNLTADFKLAGARGDWATLWETFSTGGVAAAMKKAEDFAATLMDTDGGAEVFFGPVIDHKGKNVELGVYEADGTTNKLNNHDITINDNANVYLVNYKGTKDGERVSATTASALVKASIPKSALSEEDNVITWEKVSSAPRFAFVKTVEGNATDIVVYAPAESKIEEN